MRSRAEPGVDAAGANAVDAALRALRHRDRSASEIAARLAELGIEEDERDEALATLVRTGLVDDRRFAENRASSLAARGAGNALIRHELAAAGVDEASVENALAEIEDERERANRLVARRGATPKTARYLAGKGFSDDVVRAAIARAGDDALG